ncbi:MAG: hypothetical protein M1815_001957 [Lichina confinis]|nr:MAG: hypothetical protein M1815_001957 [Lichina confinis]
MDHSSAPLFDVYLRLKPSASTAGVSSTTSFEPATTAERYLAVEEPFLDSASSAPTHIVVSPPADSRRRAVEKFAFTRVFQEDASQLDIFKGVDVLSLVEGVLAPPGTKQRDGLVATLGVTSSGKSHTILGSTSQRGLTQLALDVLYRSLEGRLVDSGTMAYLTPALAACDASEAHIVTASAFLDGPTRECSVDRMTSRAQTPMASHREPLMNTTSLGLYPSLFGQSTGYYPRGNDKSPIRTLYSNTARVTRNAAKAHLGSTRDAAATPSQNRRHVMQRHAALPQTPDVSDIVVPTDDNADFVVLVSMYEVYNDRIFDLLESPNLHSATPVQKGLRRRPLLFKSTEHSPDRKVVAGLRKVICADVDEALMVLETGLLERRVAGTGSNSLSSRSHGFFCVEVQKRSKQAASQWTKSTLTIVDLAGSERARNAKTAGATLAEAGKINESLMYLGQCLQMQGDRSDGNKSAIVPFRHCKLTELLFSNSFPTGTGPTHRQSPHQHAPQKAIMIVTADAVGDFNATSQILRYSALAREVTVPRIPSVASTLWSRSSVRDVASGRNTPAALDAESFALVAQEIARLTEEVEAANMRLTEEQNRRHEAELALEAALERCIAVEQDIREDCWIECEARLEEERRRWKGAWCEEADRNDEHLDRKLEVLTRSIQIYEDPAASVVQQLEEVEHENEDLRRKVANMERELHGRSPTKKRSQRKIAAPAKPMAAAAVSISGDSDAENTVSLFDSMKLADVRADVRADAPSASTSPLKARTPGKKQRKLTTRKWDLAPDDSDA